MTTLCLGVPLLFANNPLPVSEDDDVLFKQETRQFFILSDKPLVSVDRPLPPGGNLPELSVFINMGEPKLFYFFAEEPQTRAQAKARYKKNNASANHLHRYRVPFDRLKTWNPDWEEHAVADIRAKYMLINELLSPTMEKFAPELAEKQFFLAYELFWDFKGELPYKRFNYEPILALKNVGKNNPAQTFAKYLAVRQDFLAKICKKLRPALKNGILRYRGHDAKKVYDFYNSLFSDEHRRDSPSEDEVREKLRERLRNSLPVHEQLTFLVWWILEEPLPDDLRKELPRLIKNLNEYIQAAEKENVFKAAFGT